MNQNLRHTINQLITENINEKIYYHGRKQGKAPRSVNDKSIYITDDLNYASDYSDGKSVYMFTIPFDINRIFSIKNKNHLTLLAKVVDKYAISKMVADSGTNNELDWSSIDYISNEDFELSEDILKHLGFLGVKLHERLGIESIYIFNENQLTFKGLMNITK
jgi:hypothetical protein